MAIFSDHESFSTVDNNECVNLRDFHRHLGHEKFSKTHAEALNSRFII